MRPEGLTNGAHSTTDESPSQALATYLSALWPDGIREDSLIVASGGSAPALRCGSVREFARSFPAWESYHANVDGFSGGWIGLAQVSREVEERGAYARGALHEVTALPGLWLDVDIESDKKPKGPDREHLRVALTMLAEVGLAPSMLVRSGPSGVHVYWLFREPLDLAGDDRAAELARHAEVHGYLHRVVSGLLCEIAGRTVQIDRVIDATRVLRPPGGRNLKPEYGEGGFRVTIERLIPRRYSLSEIEESLVLLDTFAEAGEQKLGRYSDHSAIRDSIPRRVSRATEGELPRDVPAFVTRISKILPGLMLRIMARDGRPWIAKLGVACPLCSSPTSPQRAGDSYVSVRSGVYRCHHASCVAHGGLSLSDWTSRDVFGLTPDEQREVLRLYIRNGRKVTRLVPDSARKIARDEVAMEILQSINQSAVGKAMIVAIPTGSGKTRALAMISAHIANVALFFENYARVDEFLAEREAYVREERIETAPVIRIRRGVAKACSFADVVEKLAVERNLKSEACGTCALKATCDAHAVARKGEVLVSVHAGHASLRNEGQLRGRVVVFDEAPNEILHAEFGMRAISKSMNGAMFAKRSEDSKHIKRTGFLAQSILEALHQHWFVAGKPKHGMRFSAEKLREVALKTLGAAVHEISTSLGWLDLAMSRSTASGAPDPIFPRLSIDELQTIAARGGEVPHDRAIEDLWRALPAMIADLGEPEAAERAVVLREAYGELSGWVDGSGAPAFELRRRAALARSGEDDPLDRGCVILSATGSLHVERIQALDRASKVELVGMDVRGDAPHMRVFVATNKASRKALLFGSALRQDAGATLAWNKIVSAARAALRRAQARYGGALAVDLASRVGVMTFKGVRDKLDGCEEWGEKQRAAGIAVQLHGHYGADDQGSNEFLARGVRLLVSLGDPVWNVSAVEADAEFLGISPTSLSEAMVTERLAQTEGRLRAGWDRVEGRVLTVHVHVGARMPGHWEEGEVEVIAQNELRDWRWSASDNGGEPVSLSDSEAVKVICSETEFTRMTVYKDKRVVIRVNSDNVSHRADVEAARRILVAAGWVVHHGVRSFPGRGRAATWAPPSWTRPQVEAWAAARLARLQGTAFGQPPSPGSHEHAEP